MSEAPLSPTDPAANDRSWRLWSSTFVVLFVIVSVILGFVIFPSRGESTFEPYAAICRALGVPGYETIPQDPGAATASAPVSAVEGTVSTRQFLAHASAIRGEAIAKDTCSACHGDDGRSTDPTQFPVLAGQSVSAIYKELRDFNGGDRKSDMMEPIAQSLTQEQMADAAAYYASRASDDVRVADSAVLREIVALAREGDPARGIPSCDSCHGPSRSGPEGTPILLGQSATYIEEQLKHFGSRERHNDVFERMRTIAHRLTPEEVHALAIYYHGMPVAN